MNKKSPLISVIMPVYNTEKYLDEAIKSILNQTLDRFEFIILDDGSTDNSWKIIQKYAKKDKRIITLQNHINKWIACSRNKLINTAKTNYIAPQDSDDVSKINRLELCYNFLKNDHKYAVVSWNNIIIDEKGSIIWRRIYTNKIKQTILKKSPLSQWSCMFRKNIFQKMWWYDDKLNYWEDYDLWLRFFAQWYKIKNLNKDLYLVRIRKWQTKSNKIKETIKNTILIQKKAIDKYWIMPNISDILYHKLERLLLHLPNCFILWLFKKIEYKNAK